jgi:S1-C subfamily serine protease
MSKILTLTALTVLFLMPNWGFAAAQSARPGSGQLGISVNERAVHIDPGYGVSEGALIADIAPGSAAEKAGLEVGDIILGINGVAVRNAENFRRRMGLLRTGQSVDLKVERGGQRRTITATIAPR